MAAKRKQQPPSPDKEARRRIASGFRLFGAGRYAEAKEPCARVLPLRGTTILDAVDRARINHMLGLYLRETGDLPGAKAHLLCALEHGTTAFARDDPAFVPMCDDLGGVLHALGDLEGAKALYHRTLALDREQQRTASTLCRLGAVLEDAGDLGEAHACYERALHVAEARHPESPELVMALNRLSMLLFHRGDRKRGRAIYQRAVAVTKVALKDEAPEAAARAAHIALALHIGVVKSHALH